MQILPDNHSNGICVITYNDSDNDDINVFLNFWKIFIKNHKHISEIRRNGYVILDYRNCKVSYHIHKSMQSLSFIYNDTDDYIDFDDFAVDHMDDNFFIIY